MQLIYHEKYHMRLVLMQQSTCNASYSNMHNIQYQVLGVIMDQMQPTYQLINTRMHVSMIIFAMEQKKQMGIII